MGEGALSRRNENCTLETLPRACWVVGGGGPQPGTPPSGGLCKDGGTCGQVS